MKKLFISLALVGAVAFSAQDAFAWEGIQSLNPLPYVGIGQNNTDFSLNPFTGFKNCNKCKVKKVKCNECAKAKIKTCPTCKKAFNEPDMYIQPIVPKCTSCGR